MSNKKEGQSSIPGHRTAGQVDYRLDIQGLRAVAVLSVVLFHMGFFLPGGYLGVDIFFVISGYVVGGVLLKSSRPLRAFYLARFMRLAPASSVLILTTLIVFLVFFWADSYQSLPLTAMAGLFFGANIAVEITTGEYFDSEATMNPLLHLWSLSVEEQIYLVFPFLAIGLLLAIRRGKSTRWTFTVIGLLGTLSLALAFFGSSELRGFFGFGEAFFGFYSPVTRLWEFLSGFAVIWHQMFRSKRMRYGPFWSVIGFVLISFGLLVPGSHSPTSVALTVLVVAGAVLLIAFPSALSRAILKVPALVWIGNRSYSIYLWHWPPVVIAHITYPDNVWAPVIASIIGVSLGYLSHRYLESPFRLREGLTTVEVAARLRKVVALFVSVTLLVTPAQYLSIQDGDFRILPGNDLDGDVNDRGWFQYAGLTFEICPHPISGEVGLPDGEFHGCLISRMGQPVDIYLIGDSHAAHYFVGIAEQFPDHNVMFLNIPAGDYELHDVMEAYQKALGASPTGSLLIFSYRWEGYTENQMPKFANLDTSAQGKRFKYFAVNGTPTLPFDPVHCAHGYGIFSLAPRCEFSLSDERVMAQQAIGFHLERELSRLGGGTVLDSFRVVCDGAVCSARREDSVLFADAHHLNILGSRAIAGELLVEIK